MYLFDDDRRSQNQTETNESRDDFPEWVWADSVATLTLRVKEALSVSASRTTKKTKKIFSNELKTIKKHEHIFIELEESQTDQFCSISPALDDVFMDAVSPWVFSPPAHVYSRYFYINAALLAAWRWGIFI